MRQDQGKQFKDVTVVGKKLGFHSRNKKISQKFVMVDFQPRGNKKTKIVLGCPNGSRDVIGYENGGFSTAGNGHASSTFHQQSFLSLNYSDSTTQTFADVNERSVDGDDLERLGYTQYRGGNRENAYKVVDIFRGHIQDPLESSF